MMIWFCFQILLEKIRCTLASIGSFKLLEADNTHICNETKNEIIGQHLSKYECCLDKNNKLVYCGDVVCISTFWTMNNYC